MCVMAAVGSVPLIVAGDYLSILEHSLHTVSLNDFVQVPSASTGENT